MQPQTEVSTVCFKIPTIDQVTFTLECLNEDLPIRGNAVATGNDAEDKEIEDDLIDQVNNGNEWAWCCAKVTASYKGQGAADYLGCCSYKDEKDFIKNSGYYEDMKQTTFKELLVTLQELAD